MITTFVRALTFVALVSWTGLASAEDVDPCELSLVAVSTAEGGAKMILRLMDPSGQGDLKEGLTPAAHFNLIVDQGGSGPDRLKLIKAPVRLEFMTRFNDLLSEQGTLMLSHLPLNQSLLVNTRTEGRIATITRRDGDTFELRARNDAITAAVVFDRREDPVSIKLDAKFSVIGLPDTLFAGEYLAQYLIARLFPSVEAASNDDAPPRGLVH